MEKEIEIPADMISAMFQSEFVPVGSVQCFAMVAPPQGYLLCNGKEYPCCVYPDLYKAIGNTFGGIKDHTFCVPDLRGKFVRGWVNDGSIDCGRKFGTVQKSTIPSHSHGIDYPKSISTQKSGNHDHVINYERYKVGSNIGEDDRMVRSIGHMGDAKYYSGYSEEHSSLAIISNGEHEHCLELDKKIKVTDMTEIKGNIVSVGNDVIPVNLTLQYCIKAISLVGFTSGASIKLTLNVTEKGTELNSDSRFSKEQKDSFYEVIKEECMRKDISTKEDFLNAAGQYLHENTLLNRIFGVKEEDPQDDEGTPFDKPIYYLVEFIMHHRHYQFLPQDESEIRKLIFDHVNNFISR